MPRRAGMEVDMLSFIVAVFVLLVLLFSTTFFVWLFAWLSGTPGGSGRTGDPRRRPVRGDGTTERVPVPDERSAFRREAGGASSTLELVDVAGEPVGVDLDGVVVGELPRVELADGAVRADGRGGRDLLPFGDAAVRERGWWRDGSVAYDLFRGAFRGGGAVSPGAVVRMPSGRVKVYVKNPSQRLSRRAHNGRCLTLPRSPEFDGGEGWRELHFRQRPETVEDGIRYVESLMEEP